MRWQAEYERASFIGSLGRAQQPAASRQDRSRPNASQVEGRKPAWEAGAQHAIKRKLNSKQAAATPASVASIWAAADADTAELLDDEELLTEEDHIRPEAPGADKAI